MNNVEVTFAGRADEIGNKWVRVAVGFPLTIPPGLSREDESVLVHDEALRFAQQEWAFDLGGLELEAVDYLD